MVVKYADDFILLGLILTENELSYTQEIHLLTEWCNEYNLLHNVKKTKKIIFDIRKKSTAVHKLSMYW